MEALKRLIFIQWYGASEPLAYTGIGELDKEVESNNLKILINLLNTDGIGTEFKGMISHYYSVSDWYFDSYFDFSQLNKAISESLIETALNLPFNSRGQNGNQTADSHKSITLAWNLVSLQTIQVALKNLQGQFIIEEIQ